MKFYVFKDPATGVWRWTTFTLPACAGFADTQREAFDEALADLEFHYSMEATA
jgi:hypothetical protein